MNKISLMILVWIFGSMLILVSFYSLDLYSLKDRGYKTKGLIVVNLYTLLMLFIIFMELLYKLLIY